MSRELGLARELVRKLEEAEKTNKVQLSELQPGETFKIGEHDLEVKKNQASKFAQAWHPLKVVLALRWRENQYENIASEKMNVFVNSLAEYYKLDWPIKKNWNTFLAMLKPIK